MAEVTQEAGVGSVDLEGPDLSCSCRLHLKFIIYILDYFEKFKEIFNQRNLDSVNSILLLLNLDII